MMADLLQGSMYGLVAWVLGLLLAVGVHEYGHARTAYALGDTTAADVGRMTLNPFKHLSLWGTLFLAFFGFGWSEPVPVDPRNFRFPRRDSLLTAFAGPVANVFTAVVFGLVGRVLPDGTRLPELIAGVVFVNLLLAFFNILPVPPLDGATVLPYLFARRPEVLMVVQRQGFLLILGLVFLNAVTGGRILGTLVSGPALYLARLFMGQGGLF